MAMVVDVEGLTGVVEVAVVSIMVAAAAEGHPMCGCVIGGGVVGHAQHHLPHLRHLSYWLRRAGGAVAQRRIAVHMGVKVLQRAVVSLVAMVNSVIMTTGSAPAARLAMPHAWRQIAAHFLPLQSRQLLSRRLRVCTPRSVVALPCPIAAGVQSMARQRRRMTLGITLARLHATVTAIRSTWLDVVWIVLRCLADVAVVVKLLVLVDQLASMVSMTRCLRIDGELMAGWARGDSVHRRLVELARAVVAVTA